MDPWVDLVNRWTQSELVDLVCRLTQWKSDGSMVFFFTVFAEVKCCLSYSEN